MRKIFLLLGSNRGDLKKNLINALKWLEKKKIKVIKSSKIYRTKPWGYKDQPDFLNMAIEVECHYEPGKLLSLLKEIETRMGRKKNGQRWGPRIIDIDILFYDHYVIRQRELTIPHKEFYNRPFALKLLSDIAPDFIPPFSQRPIRHHLKEKNNEGFEVYCD